MSIGKLNALHTSDNSRMAVFDFGSKIMAAFGSYAYAVVGMAGLHQATATHGQWLNLAAIPEGKTEKLRFVMNAGRKFYDLVQGVGDPDKITADYITTPRVFPEGSDLESPGLPGGIRVSSLVVALSGQAGLHDRLIAAAMIWSMVHKTQCGEKHRDVRVSETMRAKVVELKTADPKSCVSFLEDVTHMSPIHRSSDEGALILVTTTDVRDLGPTIGFAIKELVDPPAPTPDPERRGISCGII